MAEHRVPMLGAALRRATFRGKIDPEHSADPQVRELVAALSTLEVAPAPRADFRAELRAQLVAVTPRLVAEGDPSLTTADERAEQKRRAARTAEDEAPKRGFRFARPLIAAACVLTAFIVLLGGAVWISQKALPGDALYGLKRASENTEYGLTGGTVAKAKLKLEFAENRINEAAALLHDVSAMGPGVGAVADGGVSKQTDSLIRQTLGSADSDVQDAARMLAQAANRSRSAAPLSIFTDWAPNQLDNMKQHVVMRIPTSDTSLITRATKTWTLIKDANTVATSLKRVVTKPAGTSVPTPAKSTTTRPAAPSKHSVPVAPNSTTAPAPGTTITTRAGGVPTRTKGHVVPGGTSKTGSSTPPPKSSHPVGLPTTSLPGSPSLPGISPLPSLPSLLPSSSALPEPITVNSCGIKASLGPINITLGTC